MATTTRRDEASSRGERSIEPAVSPIRRSIHVPVAPARAFEAFTAHVADWWNRAYTANPTRAPITDIVFETNTGGRWYERGADGSECEWARLLVCTPPHRLVLDWHVAGRSTELEVRFDGPAPRRTDITVTHSGFESFGNDAERVRTAHDDGWDDLLKRLAGFLQTSRQADAARTECSSPTPRSVTDGETVLATMDLPASPERIFRALTTEETEQWWGAPDTYRVTAWQSDLKVGGRWSVSIRLADGSLFPASGEYLSIDAPHRMIQTRRYDWDYPELGQRDTTVTYLLDPIASGTRVTVRQDGFAGLRGPADHHAEGWEAFLRYLADYVAGEPG